MPAWLFPPLAICLSGFLIGNTPDPTLRLSAAPSAIAHFASGCTVVFLWWFCLACFDRQFVPRGRVLAVGLTWVALAAADRLNAAPTPVFSYALVGLGLGIVGHLIWRLYAEREGDLIQQRRDARVMVAVLLGGQLLTDLSIDLLLGTAWRPTPFTMAQNAAILAFSLLLAGKILAVRPRVISLGGVAEAASSLVAIPAIGWDERVDDELQRRLIALMEIERVHLDPDLTFATFVQRMNAPERVVRKLVNHELGFDHFRSFLNHYRLMEARSRLADPHQSDYKLIAIAFDSGFASLPSFNRVFRASEARTPSEYRDAALAARSMAQECKNPEKYSSIPAFEK